MSKFENWEKKNSLQSVIIYVLEDELLEIKILAI